ncbi:MAG: hypothetical protein JJU36_01135, partial [Phycisphaeraceae bacterium]|nr:hypothetical protein [Phycisphaeraceae bacterium]
MTAPSHLTVSRSLRLTGLIACIMMATILIPQAQSAADKPAELEFERPFLFMNRQEIESARRKLESEPWMAESQEWTFRRHRGDSQIDSIRRMFDYLVKGDERAGEQEKRELLSFIDSKPDHRPWSDHYLTALRYDVLYSQLTDDEKQRLRAAFMRHIQHALNTQRTWDRINWLPNMQWPRKFSSHLLALALGERELIEQMAASSGGWKWYMDEYIADGRFYMEEFGKHYSMVGEMLLWCRGLERVGMNELGFGYVGRNGATMKNYLMSAIDIGYPRVDIPDGLPHYAQVTMGDARGGPRFAISNDDWPGNIIQHSIVNGYMPNGAGGNNAFMAANMNGRDHRWRLVDKMLAPLWFEIGHKQWPDAGFDYFLAQMRRWGADRYYPSPLFGLDPIDPARVQPPPAESYVARERGFALLRARHGREYWESPAPAVSLLFAMYYVHYTHDSFSLAGFYGRNRPLYLNRHVGAGYAGGCPWTDSVRGHAGVIVDNRQARFVDSGNHGTPNHIVRQDFSGSTRFTSIQARGVYPEVTQQRALFLTEEYMLDLFHLQGDSPHRFHWSIHAMGQHDPDVGRWTPARLDPARFYNLEDERVASRLGNRPEWYLPRDPVEMKPGEESWTAAIMQNRNPHAGGSSALPDAWFQRQVGVRIHMLGEPGVDSTIITGRTPTPIRRFRDRDPDTPDWRTEPAPEADVGGTSLIVERTNTRKTTFIALHEPVERDWRPVEAFESVARNDRAVAVAVRGANLNDRIMVTLLHDPDDESWHTLAGENGERFTFQSHAVIRAGNGEVRITGR